MSSKMLPLGRDPSPSFNATTNGILSEIKRRGGKGGCWPKRKIPVLKEGAKKGGEKS